MDTGEQDVELTSQMRYLRQETREMLTSLLARRLKTHSPDARQSTGTAW